MTGHDFELRNKQNGAGPRISLFQGWSYWKVREARVTACTKREVSTADQCVEPDTPPEQKQHSQVTSIARTLAWYILASDPKLSVFPDFYHVKSLIDSLHRVTDFGENDTDQGKFKKHDTLDACRESKIVHYIEEERWQLLTKELGKVGTGLPLNEFWNGYGEKYYHRSQCQPPRDTPGFGFVNDQQDYSVHRS